MNKYTMPPANRNYEQPGQGWSTRVKRRGFIKYAGAAAIASGLLLGGCDKDDEDVGAQGGIDLGSGDLGLLNYAYALEQLQAAFYTELLTTRYSGITGAEQFMFEQINGHETAHREFLKAVLGPNAIPEVEPDFSKINFSSKTGVLQAAKNLKELSVSAYNGAGRLFADANNLLFLLKIASVEARHAAAIRDMMNPRSADFAGDEVVDPASGLDVQRSPADVLALATPYFKTKLNGSNLPS